MRSTTFLALAASFVSAQAAYQGFNYGATKSDDSTPRVQSDFESLFSQAKGLVGTNGGFTSARLYTTIQAGTTNTPTSAIPAAIAQDTTLLLGLWASSGQETITNEIAALTSAISQYGSAFTSRVAGISVGSEDLYRISPTGIENHSNPGAGPAVVADYIKQVKAAIQGTALSGAAVGHVDTWTAWVNGTNQAVIDASDWVGMDAYPYFQNTMANSIESGSSLFDDALGATQSAVGGKPVWITETGWPVAGDASNLAIASDSNAKTYWDAVGCPRFGATNIWWFTLELNDNSAAPNPDLAVASAGSTTPLFDLSCSGISSSSSSSATATSSGASSASSASAASVSSAAASGALATSGGLTPTQGNGIGASAAASPASTATGGVVGGSGSGNSTGLSTTAKPTGSSTATGTSPASTVVTNVGNVISGSFVAVGALIVGMLAL